MDLQAVSSLRKLGVEVLGKDEFGLVTLGVKKHNGALEEGVYNRLCGADLSTLDLSGVLFTDMNLRGASFHGSKLLAASFANSDLTDANFGYCQGEDCVFDASNMTRVSAKNSRLARASFKYATLLNADFSGSDLSCAKLFGARMNGIDLSFANMDSASGHYCFISIMGDHAVAAGDWASIEWGRHTIKKWLTVTRLLQEVYTPRSAAYEMAKAWLVASARLLGLMDYASSEYYFEGEEK